MITLFILTIVTPFVVSYVFPPAICQGEQERLLKRLQGARKQWRRRLAREDAWAMVADHELVFCRDVEEITEHLIKDVPHHYDQINLSLRESITSDTIREKLCRDGVCTLTWHPRK